MTATATVDTAAATTIGIATATVSVTATIGTVTATVDTITLHTKARTAAKGIRMRGMIGVTVGAHLLLLQGATVAEGIVPTVGGGATALVHPEEAAQLGLLQGTILLRLQTVTAGGKWTKALTLHDVGGSRVR